MPRRRRGVADTRELHAAYDALIERLHWEREQYIQLVLEVAQTYGQDRAAELSREQAKYIRDQATQ